MALPEDKYGESVYGFSDYGAFGQYAAGEGAGSGWAEPEYAPAGTSGGGVGVAVQTWTFVAVGEGAGTGLGVQQWTFIATGSGAGTGLAVGAGGGSWAGGSSDSPIIAALAAVASYIFGLEVGRTYSFSNAAYLGGGRFNQKQLALLTDGVYDIETVATDDDGTDIDATLAFTTDFGVEAFKRLRSVYCNANVKVTLYDESGTILNTIDSLTAEDIVGIPRSVRERVFKVQFENIDGEQITIKKIHGRIDILGRKGV